MLRSRTSYRLTLTLFRAALLLMLAACQRIGGDRFGGDVDALLADGRRFAERIADAPAQRLSDEEVIALGYLERARLGLGSPFRLVAFALHDPRLGEEVRVPLSYAILDATVRGEVYRVDPSVLDALPLAGVRQRVRVGAHHLPLIERAIRDASDPRVGERAVRLGYRLAELEGSVAGVGPGGLIPIAAMIADRETARRDAAALLHVAAAWNEDPLMLLQQWRAALRFGVERPALVVPHPPDEAEEARRALEVARAVRRLEQRLSAPSTLVNGSREATTRRAGLLTPEVAARLARLNDQLPQAPITAAVLLNRSAFEDSPELPEWRRAERARFAAEARNEERLVAAAALLRNVDPAPGRRLSVIELQAAVFLRPWNQEEPWFPGDPAPAARDLVARFGLAGISFAANVPQKWHPYYLRMLGLSLARLQRVLPAASFRGLSFRIGDLPDGSPVLALHDPQSRTIYLPPATSAGTLAHEIAHDLDWQLARRQYGRRGTYATDHAMNRRRPDAIAASLDGLAGSIAAKSYATPSPHDERPAEVFARGMDWFIAAALAREGRTGEHLSSFQDAAITGYGSTRGQAVVGGIVPSLLTILDPIAPVSPEIRSWMLDTHGPTRVLSPAEMVEAIGSAGQNQPAWQRFAAIEDARDLALRTWSAESCDASATGSARELRAARRDLIHAAASAAARGAAAEAAMRMASELGTGIAPAAVHEWLAWRMDGAPEPADSVLISFATGWEDLVWRAEEVAASPRVPQPNAFAAFGRDPLLCGGNPFAGLPIAGQRTGARPWRAASTPVPDAAAHYRSTWRNAHGAANGREGQQ